MFFLPKEVAEAEVDGGGDEGSGVESGHVEMRRLAKKASWLGCEC